MYQLLIVDDEKHAVQAIRLSLDWDRLGVNRIHCVYNIRQAQKVLEQYPVDIMISDIEMPKGSGMDLLSYVKAQRFSLETIFLTCHADFQYAQQALQLGSLNYMLKPFHVHELEEAVSQAIDKRRSDRARFWAYVASGYLRKDSIPLMEDEIPYAQQIQFIPARIDLLGRKARLSIEEERALTSKLRSDAEKLIIEYGTDGIVLSVKEKSWLIVLITDNSEDVNVNQLTDYFDDYIRHCNVSNECDISCRIGSVSSKSTINGEINSLLEADESSVVIRPNTVYEMRNAGLLQEHVLIPDMLAWSEMLKKGSFESVRRESDTYFDQLKIKPELDVRVLSEFYQAFMQTVYHVLQTKSLQASLMFTDEVSRRLGASSCGSVLQLKAWVHHVLDKAAEHIQLLNEKQSLIDRIQAYVLQNIDHELTREEISQYVFLTPDYVSKLFKKETGMSISDFILREKIKLAKELLAKTNLPVSKVADSIGYSNFSYFAKIFRKECQVSPLDFRKKHR